MNRASKTFSFNDDNFKKAQAIIAHYPDGRQKSAVIALLDIAQRQIGGWLSQAAIEYVAIFLSMPAIRVHEIATFYTMFNLKPVGKYHIQICSTTPCWLRGSDQIIKGFEEALSIELGQVTKNGMFSLAEVECLGACTCAPVVQINDDYNENLTPQMVKKIINDLKAADKKQTQNKTNELP